MTSKSDPGLEKSFAAALRAAQDAPDSEDAWDHLEDLAGKMDRPDEVAALFRETLERPLPKEVADRLGERAVGFHEEWFGDNPSAVTDLLSSIIERDPGASWAFDRLTVALTAAERWDALLAVYDDTLATLRDPERRKQLLDDAAQVAKDFAEQPARAADYLSELLKLDPGNTKLEASLARLLERQERWNDLIELWRGQLEHASTNEGRKIRVRIAACCVDRLEAPARALDELEVLLSESPGHERGCEQVERVLALDSGEVSDRKRALGLLRRNYDAARRPEDVVKALQAALGFIDEEGKAAVHRELGSRLAILGRDEDALGQYGELICADPTDTDARKQVRQLAKRSKRDDLHAEILVRAADAAEDESQQIGLLLEAAHLHQDSLDDTDRAAELYQRILGLEDADPTLSLSAAHSLNELLAAAGKAQERLPVLEQVAKLERSRAVRRSVLGEAAQLAAELGDTDRALADWRRRLEIDAGDLEALNAIIAILESNERWDELIDALRRRAEGTALVQQKREDLIKVASIQEKALDDAAAAVETWLGIRDQFGDEDVTIEALDRLLTALERYQELVDVLAGASGRVRAHCGARLVRVGQIQAEQLDQPEQALSSLGRALAMDHSNADARAGLTALLEVESCRAQAAAALVRAYESSENWEALLGLLEARLEGAATPSRKGALLLEAAMLQEQQSEDLEAAHELLCRGIELDPANLIIEAELQRVAEATNRWAETAEALRAAAANAEQHPRRSAELSFAAGHILESHVNDMATATDAFALAAAMDPRNIQAHEAVARCGARAARWETCVGAAMATIRARERLEDAVADDLETGADKNDGFGALATAFRDALAESAGGLNRALARVLELRVAEWFQRAGEEDAAKDAARRAVELDPSHPESLGVLVELQRENPSAALVDTLLRVDSLSEGGLDALREAAEVALEHAEGETARQTLVRLYRKAARMWARSDRASGEHAPPETAIWALERLVEHYESGGDVEEAVRLLLDGATLPLGADAARELRRRAAERLVDQGLRSRAIELYASILTDSGNDMALLARAAELCEQGNRVAELLELRHRELEVTEDPERRLELRLELSRLSGLMETRGGRVEALLANLDESPGHVDSIQAVTEILVERGQHERLVEILEAQATKLTELAKADDADEETRENAARLWGDVGRLAVDETHDAERAISAFSKVVELASNIEALDALAKLELEAGNPAKAAKWLSARLESGGAGERVAILLRLARAQLQAEENDAAIESLETAFSEAPRNGEIRKLLTNIYRTRNDWQALARVLSTAAQNVGDSGTVLAYAREAASIYHDRLGQPEMAVPVLEKALEIASDDRQLRSMLAEGLRVAGRLDEAQALLTELVAQFGRRRSPERAAAHLQLARVLGAQGHVAEAIDQLETASKMDSGNLAILKALGGLARQDSQFDRAERAFRTLLVQVRRANAEELAQAQTGPCTTLIELAGIAQERGQPDKAEELIESALEALAENDSEADFVQALLRERGDHALLRRVLDARLQYVKEPHLLGRLYDALADLLETDEGEREKSLDLRLEAVTADPGSPALHDAAARLAGEMGSEGRYRETLESLLESTRRSGDAHVRCEVALRLGQALENGEDQLDRAAELYDMANAAGVRQVDVWRAMARLAGVRGDSERQVELLEKLASLGADQAETRSDALYRMAEVHLATPDGTDAGIDALRRALEENANYMRAAIILERAANVHESHHDLFDVYESVARKSADAEVLLAFLERNLRRPDAPLDHAKEAVDIASRLEQFDRAEELMLRAIELAEDVIDGKSMVAWAFLGLADRRRAGGDLAGAVKWLGEATDHAELGALLETANSVAEVGSQPDGDMTLVAKLYERLLERDSSDRRIWEPLARAYGALGDIDQLERMVEETLDGLETTAERNQLRIQLARALLSREDRGEDAVEILRDALMEAPEDMDAQLLLASHLESTGDVEALLDLLRNQLMAAQGRGKPDEIRIISLQLIGRLRDDDLAEAISVCRSALDVATEDGELLRMLLELEGDDLEGPERIELMQRLLAVETSEHAPSLTAELVALCNEHGDEDGAVRALEIGYGRAPTDPDLRARLKESYQERQDHGGLAQILTDSAEAAESLEDKLSLLREAAAVHAEHLHSPTAASDLLKRCCELAPEDVESRIALARALSAGLQHDEAIATLSEIIDSDGPVAGRLALLQVRAEVNSDAGDADASLADLEAAAEIDLDAVVESLEVALQEKRSSAMRRGELDEERRVTFRLIELAGSTGRSEVARDRLLEWTQRDPDDLSSWQRLRDACAAVEDWETVANCCTRLISLGDDEMIGEAAIALADACRRLERPDEAREGLEAARERQPDNAAVRNELIAVYEQTGAHAQLAGLLLEDAEATEDADEKLEILRRASALLSTGVDLPLAVQTLTRILEVDPEDKLSTALLADTYVATGDLDAADALLDATIAGYRVARSPELSSFQHRKARVAQARGDLDGQLEFLKAAFAADKQNGPAAAELAVLAEEVEDFDLATRVLRGITVLEGPCPISRADAFLRQGRISLRTGDVKRASFWARRARQEDPEFGEAQQFLDEISGK